MRSRLFFSRLYILRCVNVCVHMTFWDQWFLVRLIQMSLLSLVTSISNEYTIPYYLMNIPYHTIPSSSCLKINFLMKKINIFTQKNQKLEKFKKLNIFKFKKKLKNNQVFEKFQIILKFWKIKKIQIKSFIFLKI